MASQLKVALVFVMFEEVKPVGIPQLAVVENGVGSLNELDPAEQTVCTWKSYDVPGVSVVKLLEDVVRLGIVAHVDADESFHWRL